MKKRYFNNKNLQPYSICIENRIHDNLIKVNVKVVIIGKVNMFSASQEKIDLFLNKIREKYPNLSVLKSFMGKNQYRFKDRYTKDINNDDNIIFAVPCEQRQGLKNIFENLKEIHNEFVSNELISKKKNKLILTKKAYYELDLTDFMEKQPEKIYMMGAMFFSDGRYTHFDRKENDMYVYPESYITLVPNPRYVKGSYEDFDNIIKYFDEDNFHSKIILPYPIGEDKEKSKKIIKEVHNVKSKASLIIFTLYKPYFMSNSDTTIVNIPSISSVYHFHISKPIREKELNDGQVIRIQNEYTNQTLETNTVFEIAKAYILPYLSNLLLKKSNNNSCTDINIYKFFQNLMKYFYLGAYDANSYNNIPNIMNFDKNGDYFNIFEKPRPPFYKKRKENKYNDKKMKQLLNKTRKINKKIEDYDTAIIENTDDKYRNAKLIEHEFAYHD